MDNVYLVTFALSWHCFSAILVIDFFNDGLSWLLLSRFLALCLRLGFNLLCFLRILFFSFGPLDRNPYSGNCFSWETFLNLLWHIVFTISLNLRCPSRDTENDVANPAVQLFSGQFLGRWFLAVKIPEAFVDHVVGVTRNSN